MNSKGSDTLLQASSDCKFRLLRTVVEGGTSVDIWDNNRQTPLMLACSSAVESEDKEKVIHYLLKKNSKVNLQDLQGRTALMLACISNSSPCVIQALIDAKANPWLEDEAGCTAFDHAINGGDLETTRLLIHSCREHKLLLKADNVVEMKHLQDCFSKIQEMRKVSWPLMGPSVRNTPAQLYCSPDAPGPADDGKLSVEPTGASPRLQRRRKRSICHFDPLDIEEIMKHDQRIETEFQPVSPTKVENTARTTKGAMEDSSGPSERTRPPSLSKMTEDERISLHFSSTESSAEEPGPELATLLKLKDSVFYLNDAPYTIVPEIVTNEERGDGSATDEKNLCANKTLSPVQELQHQKSLTEEASSFQEEPKGFPYNATTACKASQKLSSVHGKASTFQETVTDAEADVHTQKGAMVTQEESVAEESEAERTKQQHKFHLENHATKELVEVNSKRRYTPTLPTNMETSRGRTESLSSLSTAVTAKGSPKPRRKTLPGTINPPANAHRNSLAAPGDRQTTEREPRRYTLSSTDASSLCGSFASQRLSPTPRDFFFIDADNRKSPTPRDVGRADELFHNSDEQMLSCARFGARSPFNDSNTNLEIVKKSDQFPALLKESTGKGVQLPTISLQRKSPLLQINTRGSGVTGREEITEISQRNEELLHIDEKCASPTNRGRISPFSGRKSPLVAKYEASIASAADTKAKPAQKSHFEAFPGRRKHSSSGKVEQEGAKHGSLATPQSSLEEHDQQKLAPLSPSKEKSKKPPTLLPPLRINNTFFSSLDSEEGYYSCSPSPFDIESPKRTPGHSEQPRYLFRPISPRSVQRFSSN